MAAVTVQADGVELDADLDVPGRARGLVVFAHVSGSSRRSPRNRQVAQALQAEGFATLLFDLLTASEERRHAADSALRFDIAMLTDRLTQVLDEAPGLPGAEHLPIGLFGASTGTAAALGTAARRPEAVAAVVSRGGRPDLAGAALGQVRAPTLLLVGERDEQVIALNRQAAEDLAGEAEMSVVPAATHLFEKPGALEEVARRAVQWFGRAMPAAG